jgi:hypothetical protein
LLYDAGIEWHFLRVNQYADLTDDEMDEFYMGLAPDEGVTDGNDNSTTTTRAPSNSSTSAPDYTIPAPSCQTEEEHRRSKRSTATWTVPANWKPGYANRKIFANKV